MSVIISRRVEKVNIRLARSRSEDIFATCIRASMTSTTPSSWYVGTGIAAKGYETVSGKGVRREDIEGEGVGTRKQTFLCMYSHGSPMHTATSARSATVYACECVYECYNAIVHIRTATRAGPDTSDKYLHMGLQGNFLKTQVPRRFLPPTFSTRPYLVPRHCRLHPADPGKRRWQVGW